MVRFRTYLGFHEYGWPHMDPSQPDANRDCGIYRQVIEVPRAHGENEYQAIITEAGLARMYMHGQDGGWEVGRYGTPASCSTRKPR